MSLQLIAKNQHPTPTSPRTSGLSWFRSFLYLLHRAAVCHSLPTWSSIYRAFLRHHANCFIMTQCRSTNSKYRSPADFQLWPTLLVAHGDRRAFMSHDVKYVAPRSQDITSNWPAGRVHSNFSQNPNIISKKLLTAGVQLRTRK